MQLQPQEPALLLESNMGLVVGLIMTGTLLAHVLLAFFVSWRRLTSQREQLTLEKERLELLVKSAKAQLRQVEEAKSLWNGYRKFTVARKMQECDDVYSFHLMPHDGKALPGFKPGQYLTFQFQFPNQPKPVVRCYSLSDGPGRREHYRVTIKRERPPADRPELPAGLVSSYFCDVLKEGDILDVRAPAGHFCLDLDKNTPVVLISGGVGITPMLSMAEAALTSGLKREVWFFHGCRNRDEHIQKQHLEELAAEHDSFRLHVCYSRPDPSDVAGRDYQHSGRVTADLIKELLPSSNYEFYLCGNGAFMKSITDGLEAWGVPARNIHFEAFGPATVKKTSSGNTSLISAAPTVTFSKSGKRCRWDPGQASLLEFARTQGVRIDSGCCAGGCGSCVVAIKSGNIEYLKPPDAPPEDGCCLTCICRPKSDLVLDA
jgi:ferredoxin-NADP reductase